MTRGSRKTSLLWLFLIFLGLGLTSFGGPVALFSIASYLGAVSQFTPNSAAGAIFAVVAIFLPGFLVLIGTIPFWDALRKHAAAQGVMRGINAAVVGLLAAALYDPVWTGAVFSISDVLIAAFGFTALVVWHFPALSVVVLTAGAHVVLVQAG